MVIVAETVICRSAATTFNDAKAVLKVNSKEMILAQDNLIYLTKEKDMNSGIYTLRTKIGATKIYLDDDIIAGNKAKQENKAGKIMLDHQGYMREQCQYIANLSQTHSSCYEKFSAELPSDSSRWSEDSWTNYVKYWDIYRDCCISKLTVLKQINDKNVGDDSETEDIDDEVILNDEDDDDSTEDDLTANISDKSLVIILGISVPVLLILVASLILYFIMRSRYRIVRRSFRLKSLSAKKGTEPTGVEGMACGSQNKRRDYTADEEEDPLYDEMCLKEPPILDQSNVYNTVAHKDQPQEEEEERLYSVVTKSCSTKPAAPEEGREIEGEYDTFCLTEEVAPEEGREIEDQELLKTSIEEILVEEYSTIDKVKLESSKAAATDDGAEASYTVLNRSSKSPEKDLETGALNTLMIKRPPKERPISKRYSCNLDLNQTLMNQPVRNMMTTVLLETDTGLDCDTRDGDALIEKEGDGDQMN